MDKTGKTYNMSAHFQLFVTFHLKKEIRHRVEFFYLLV